MKSAHFYAQQHALIEDFKSWRWNNRTAVTLTCKKGMIQNGFYIKATRDYCRKNLRHFLNKLRRACRLPRRTVLQTVAVIEQDTSGRLHHHLCIDRPDKIKPRAFAALIRWCWVTTHWGAQQINVQHDANDGWIRYLCKFRSKGSAWDEAIDWGNCHREMSTDSF